MEKFKISKITNFAKRGYKMGTPMSEETKAKLRLAMSGKKHSEETLVKLRKAMTGKKLSPESIAKMKESLRVTWEKKLAKVVDDTFAK